MAVLGCVLWYVFPWGSGPPVSLQVCASQLDNVFISARQSVSGRAIRSQVDVYTLSNEETSNQPLMHPCGARHEQCSNKGMNDWLRFSVPSLAHGITCKSIIRRPENYTIMNYTAWGRGFT